MKTYVVSVLIKGMSKLGAIRSTIKRIDVEAMNEGEAIEKVIDSLKHLYHPTRIVDCRADRKRFFNPLVYAC